MIQLRPYQEKIIHETRAAMKSGSRSILITSPTGSGKTILTAHMLKTAASKGMSSIFIVHRRELIKQSMRAFSDVGVRHGIIANGFFSEYQHQVQIASIGTLIHRTHLVKRPQLIIWDECAHIAANSWSNLFRSFPEAYHVGLTATPTRMDGRGLGDHFKTIVHGPSVRWLIDNKFLSDFKIFAPSPIDASGLHMSMGDYVKSEISVLVDKPTITGNAIKHYKKLSDGKRAVIFCVSIEHSKHVVEQFKSAGISAEHVDGETETRERDAKIEDFKTGQIKIISNVDLFGEGFDLPALETIILLRPTASIGMYLQWCGRCLRVANGKKYAIIIDHANNVSKHGFPDEDRQWTLEGQKSTKKNTAPKTSVKICEKCFACLPSNKPVCSYCGYVFKVEGRKIDEKEGDLVEIDPDVFRRQLMAEQGKAVTLENLIALGRNRGYKRPELWAGYLWRARQARKLSGV